jgi:hypothetical protein
MSFRLFIYYCALCGAWAALLGWGLGRGAGAFLGMSPDRIGDDVAKKIADAGIKGFCLGLFVSFALALLDSFLNLSSARQAMQALARVIVGVVVGSIGGMMGGMFGQLLYGKNGLGLFLIMGWTLTGLLIGLSIGVFDIALRLMRQEDIGGALRKLRNGAIGGTVGGVLGAVLLLGIHQGWSRIFADKPANHLWSPSSTGFVALGMCIGLLIGLAQIILKEAWIRVETGRRAGKEMILAKKEFILGRAESCDLGLFGDNQIEKQHAKIVRSGNRYYLEDLDTPAGTYLNGRKISEPMPLKNGDAIRLGNCTLRFGERAKR